MADSMEGLAAMKVADLKRELKERGLPTSGNKSELVERLKQVLEATGDESLNTTGLDASAEELLKDDPSMVSSEADQRHIQQGDNKTKAADDLFGDPNAILSEDILEESKPPAVEVVKKDEAVSSTEKILFPTSTEPSSAAKPNASALSEAERLALRAKKFNITSEVASDDPKVARAKKFGLPLSQEDILKIRAKKFGLKDNAETDAKPAKVAKLATNVPPVDKEKLEARQKRFGIVSPEPKNTTPKPKNDTTSNRTLTVSNKVDFDALKRRAERFGTSVSSIAKTLEEKEKILKRSERFGIVTVPATGKKEKLVITT